MDTETGRAGQVKWYDESRGFGFIETERGDMFVHISNVRDASGAAADILREGDCVSFDVKTNPRNDRPQAVNVQLIEGDAP